MQKTVKKYRKTLSSVGEKMAPCSQEFSVVNCKKRANLRKSFAFASAKYGAVNKSEQEWARVGKSEQEWARVNKNGYMDPGSEPDSTRLSPR